ncbi:CaiB/BaiF CoA-transferase family protein [Mesorhizobium sp.]|uniref:CaiB/BaiF CoA transferase family protein n=1 Tax=Mesorhizobium sp. TaxID=1871066 RepID=UPI0025DCDF7D|nr:CaiB/BaiF CoA-transferase family protein [Mesorhizobium sp.]
MTERPQQSRASCDRRVRHRSALAIYRHKSMAASKQCNLHQYRKSGLSGPRKRSRTRRSKTPAAAATEESSLAARKGCRGTLQARGELPEMDDLKKPTAGTTVKDPGPLAGVRVLDFGIVLAAPHCARLMVDMGAEVFHIERTGEGDAARHSGYLHGPGLSDSFFLQNWGKKSLSVDLKHPDGKRLIERLVAKADVVIENFRPGVIAKLGFGYERLSEINPGIIMCSVSAYGQTGPYAQRPGYGALAEAVAGVPEITGEPDGPPMPTLFAVGDNVASAMALGAICAALYDRTRTGKGRYLDISLLDATFQSHDIATPRYLASKGKVLHTRRGLLDAIYVPWGYFKGRDGWVQIKSIETEDGFATLLRAIGHGGLVGDPRFANPDARSENRAIIYDLMQKWVDGFASIRAIVDLLVDAGVPVAPVNTIPDVVKDPQILARRLIIDREHPTLGTLPLQNHWGVNFRDSQAPAYPPFLGEHNREATEIAGLSEAEFGRLSREGVLASEAAADEINSRKSGSRNSAAE